MLHTSSHQGSFVPRRATDKHGFVDDFYEQDITQQLNQAREELLVPIITDAEKAIADVAKANGYSMVFDTSMFNAVLFAAESVDIMNQVKERLGIE